MNSMYRTLTYGALTKILTDFGLTLTKTPEAFLFRHAELGALIILHPTDSSLKRVRLIDMPVIRKTLIEKGVASEEAVNQALFVDIQSQNDSTRRAVGNKKTPKVSAPQTT